MERVSLEFATDKKADTTGSQALQIFERGLWDYAKLTRECFTTGESEFRASNWRQTGLMGLVCL